MLDSPTLVVGEETRQRSAPFLLVLDVTPNSILTDVSDRACPYDKQSAIPLYKRWEASAASATFHGGLLYINRLHELENAARECSMFALDAAWYAAALDDMSVSRFVDDVEQCTVLCEHFADDRGIPHLDVVKSACPAHMTPLVERLYMEAQVRPEAWRKAR